MQPFTTFSAIAAPLPIDNVDTDKILAARFLTTISRSGLGEGLFATLRKDPDFILNNAPWNRAGILVAGHNFGCGSSREHAPWALLEFGICCVIAPSIADIFYGNCFKNGILPIKLSVNEVETLMNLARLPESAHFHIDLEAQTIAAGDRLFSFDIEASRKHALLNGIDEIASSLSHVADIAEFERERDCWRGPAILDTTLRGLI